MTERNSFLWWYFDLIFSHGLNQDWKIVHFCCFNVGDCLITVATGPLSDSDADRAGLVSTHAYALLDIRKVQVGLWLYYGNCTAYLKVKTAVNLCPADSLSFSDSQPRKKRDQVRKSSSVWIRDTSAVCPHFTNPRNSHFHACSCSSCSIVPEQKERLPVIPPTVPIH